MCAEGMVGPTTTTRTDKTGRTIIESLPRFGTVRALAWQRDAHREAPRGLSVRAAAFLLAATPLLGSAGGAARLGVAAIA